MRTMQLFLSHLISPNFCTILPIISKWMYPPKKQEYCLTFVSIRFSKKNPLFLRNVTIKIRTQLVIQYFVKMWFSIWIIMIQSWRVCQIEVCENIAWMHIADQDARICVTHMSRTTHGLQGHCLPHCLSFCSFLTNCLSFCSFLTIICSRLSVGLWGG